jgi:NAD(P)-dependent dehydrogenase (short-subunit alcohol dehydrogenase family)
MGSSVSKGLTYVFPPKKVEPKWFPDFVKENVRAENLAGKLIVITGTTTGIGFVLAQVSVQNGIKGVVMLNRPSERAAKAENDIKACIPEGAECFVESIPCDLQCFASVREAAQTIQSKYEAIDILVNNAGVMALADAATVDGYDVQMQTNHLSHFLLTKELYPLLKRAAELRGEARVIQHSSGARKMAKCLEAKYLEKNGGNLGGNSATMFFGGARWERYTQTKLANIIFGAALRDRFAKLVSTETTGDESNTAAAPTGPVIKSVVVEPGLSATSLQTTTNKDGGMDQMFIMGLIAQSPEDGSMPMLLAAFGPDVQNGDFYMPSDGFGLYGVPKKSPMDESNNNKPEWHELLWSKSEEAIEQKFSIS